jgi:hypothetical protein
LCSPALLSITMPFAAPTANSVLKCGQTRFAALELAPGASDPGEGLILKP